VQLWQLLLLIILSIVLGINIGIVGYLVLSPKKFHLLTTRFPWLMKFTGKQIHSISASNSITPANDIGITAQIPILEQQPEPDASTITSDQFEETPFKLQDTISPDILLLLPELETNLKIATSTSGEELVLLQTKIWDDNPRIVKGLNTDLKNKMELVYSNISLINMMVWLSKEFQHRSPSLVEQYRKYTGIVAKNLDEIISNCI